MATFPYPADPTVYKDGLARMLRIWEASRDADVGGYGSGVLYSVWGHPAHHVTTCSPFTGTCIGMMFDQGSAESQVTKYHPKYHGKHQLDLPVVFYQLHNGAYFAKTGVGRQRVNTFEKNGWPTMVPDADGRGRDPWDEASQMALSFEFFNLGYRIDPRDMRRGDFVGITWNDGGGHATFCWDVHTDPTGAVDAFLFVSSNGIITKKGCVGIGVSVGVLPRTQYESKFVTASGGTYSKVAQMFKDDDKYTQYGWWMVVPPKQTRDLDLKTFHPTPEWKSGSFGERGRGFGPRHLDVYRFWGFEPPEAPHGKLLTADNHDLALQLAKGGPQPDSHATKTGQPPEGRIQNVSTTPVPKSHPDPVSVPSPAPAKQAKEQVLPHQSFVESALDELHTAGWIDQSPGETDSTHDAQTRAAVKDFQSKFKSGPVDGIPGPITRAALKRAVADLRAGKPDPNKPRTAKLDRFYWVGNRVDPGGSAKLAVVGEALDLVETFELLLKDAATGRTQTISLPGGVDAARGTLDVSIPEIFAIGSALAAQLTAVASGAKDKKASNAQLHVGKIDTPPGDWPWDEKLWTPQMRDIIADLRGTPAAPGPLDRFEITQFGVKEKLEAGTVEVKSKKGQVFGTVSLKSLMLADIEGTMRLDGRILNITQSGNVYEPKQVPVDGQMVIKKKPVSAKFDPSKSLWVDVTAQNPWGAGARMPLIPYRTLAINPTMNSSMYYKKVYIKQLDGQIMPGTNERHNGICIVGDAGGMRKTHFDLFVGREDHHIGIASVGKGNATICEIQVLGDCPASHKRGR